MSVRDFDSTRNRAILIWAVLIGAVLGFAVGYFLTVDRGLPFGPAVLASSVVVATLCYLGITSIVALGATPARLLFPAGDGVTGPPPYLSRFQALVTRGQHEEAVALLEGELVSDPLDHVALIHLADLSSTTLKDPAASRGFLKRAIASGRLQPASEAFQLRRLAESFLDSSNPRDAAPQLARLADRFPATGHGSWARLRLEELKKSVE